MKSRQFPRAAKRLVLSFVFSVCAFTIALAQGSHVRIKLSSEQVDEVTFDPNRVSEKQIRDWMLLSRYGPYAVPALSSCRQLEKDPKNTEIDRQREADRKLISELEINKFPRELTDVINYFEQLQSAWYWMDSREIEFFRSADPSILEEPYEGIHPDKVCIQSLDKIRARVAIVRMPFKPHVLIGATA